MNNWIHRGEKRENRAEKIEKIVEEIMSMKFSKIMRHQTIDPEVYRNSKDKLHLHTTTCTLIV